MKQHGTLIMHPHGDIVVAIDARQASGILLLKVGMICYGAPGVSLLNTRNLGTYARRGPRPPKLSRYKDGGGFGIFRDP
jgi:hypothetical protein